MRTSSIRGFIIALTLCCCSPSSNEPSDSAPTEAAQQRRLAEANADCGWLSFVDDSAPPFGRITLEIDGEAPDDWTFRYAFERGGPAGIVPFEATADGDGWQMPVPPHPLGADGGPLFVQAVNGEQFCPIQELRVSETPAAPEAVDKVLAIAEAQLESAAALRGLSTAALHAMAHIDSEGTIVFETDEATAPLAATAFLLSHPDNSQSVKALITEMSAEERALLGGLLRTNGIEEAWAERPSTSTSTRPNGFVSIPIRSPQELADALEVGKWNCVRARSAYGLISDFIGIATSPAKNPLVIAVSTGFGAMSAVLGLASAMGCAFFPETIVSMKPAPATFNLEEDYEETLSLSKVDVKAVAGESLSFLKELVSMFFASRGLHEGREKLSATLAAATKEVLERKGSEFGSSLAVATAEFLFKEALGLPEEFEVKSGPWTVSVNGSRWVKLTPQMGNFAESNCSKVCAVPVAPGRDVLVLGLRPERFHGEYVEAAVTAENHIIEVQLPPVVLAKPATEVDVPWNVQWAIDPRLEWTTDNAQGSFTSPFTDAATGTNRFLAPADTTAYPLRIEARSLTENGLRAPAKRTGERIGAAMVMHGALFVWPRTGCVRSGESLQLQHTTFPRNNSVTWEPSPLVDDHGLFTAPAEYGAYTVTATTVVDGASYEDQVTLHVSDCRCTYQVIVSGANGAASSGEFGIDLFGDVIDDDLNKSRTIQVDLEDGKSAVLTWVRSPGPTPRVVAGGFALIDGPNTVGGPGNLYLTSYPNGHFSVNFFGPVTDQNDIVHYADVTINAVGEEEGVAAACQNEAFYEASEYSN